MPMKCESLSPGIMRALVFAWTGSLSFSQLRVGGGNPVTSQVSEMKLFITTVKFSKSTPMIEGGTGDGVRWQGSVAS